MGKMWNLKDTEGADRAFTIAKPCDDFVIPSDYLRLDYIESTGTQYIDTGYYPGPETETIYDTMQIEYTNSSQTFFGCSDGAWNNNPYIISTYGYGSFGWGNNTSASQQLGFITAKERYILKLNKSGCYKNNILILSNSGYAKTRNGHQMLLFATYYSTITEYGKNRCYCCIIRDGGITQRHFVPVLRISDSKPGLYDSITNRFYTNSGDGDFIYNFQCNDMKSPGKFYVNYGNNSIRFAKMIQGATLPVQFKRIEYIQSSGTQYINTLYAPNANTEVVYSTMQTGSYSYSSAQTFFGCSDGAWNNNAFAVSTYQNGGYGWGNAGQSGWHTWTCNLNTNYLIRLNSTGCYINEKIIGSNSGYTKTQNSHNLLFFAANYNSVTEYGQHRCYGAMIKENGSIVKIFIPAVRFFDYYGEYLVHSLKPGLYDIVNNVFYTNVGSGEFTYE